MSERELQHLSKTVQRLSDKFDNHLDKSQQSDLDTREFFGRVEKSFSNISAALQRHEGHLETINTACHDFGQRIAANETDTTGLIIATRDQWDVINRLRDKAHEDKRMFSLWPPRIVGFGVRDIMILAILLTVIFIVLSRHGMNPLTAIGIGG